MYERIMNKPDIVRIIDFNNTAISDNAMQLFNNAFDRGYEIYVDGSICIKPTNKYFHSNGYILLTHLRDDVISALYVFNNGLSKWHLGEFSVLTALDTIITMCINAINSCPSCHKLIGAKNMCTYGTIYYACDNCYKAAIKKYNQRNGITS